MAIADKDHFVAISSYLNTAAFTAVENVKLTDEQKADPKSFYPLLENALKSDSDKIPPRLKLRFRTQKPGESLSQFALELGKLANKSNMEDATREHLLIDSFCTGVKDTDLSIKLLETTFGTLTLALDYALKVEGASKIRNFVKLGHDEAPEIEILATNERHGPSSKNTELPHSTPERNVDINTQNMPQHSNFGQQYHNNNPVNNGSRPFAPQNFHSPQDHYNNQFTPPVRYGQSHNNAHYTAPVLQNYTRPPRRAQYNNQTSRTSYQPGMYRPQRAEINNNRTKTCFYCHVPGHVIRMCRLRMRDESRNFPQGPSPRQ